MRTPATIDSADQEECITVRVPRGTSLALERAAIGVRTRPSQMARRLLLDALRASGFEVAGSASEGEEAVRLG